MTLLTWDEIKEGMLVDVSWETKPPRSSLPDDLWVSAIVETVGEKITLLKKVGGCAWRLTLENADGKFLGSGGVLRMRRTDLEER